MTIELYDNTRVDSARTCLRKYYFAHHRHWQPEGKSAPLIFGSSWHEAMDIIWSRHRELFESKDSKRDIIEAAYQAFLKEWQAQGYSHPDDMGMDDIEELEPRTPMTALEMLHEYPDAREHLFRDPSFKLLTIEEPFIVPLDPSNPNLFYCGRFDKKFEFRGQILAGEHKSTTLYAKSSGFRSSYIDSWSLNSQIDGYNYALRQLHGEKSGGVWVDAALVHKTVHDKFKFISVDVKDDMLDNWLWNVHTWIDQIQANKEILPERRCGGYLAAFPQNKHSCFDYNSSCAYSDLCRMVSNPEKLTAPPMGFTERRWSPFEILDLEKIGITPEACTA